MNDNKFNENNNIENDNFNETPKQDDNEMSEEDRQKFFNIMHPEISMNQGQDTCYNANSNQQGYSSQTPNAPYSQSTVKTKKLDKKTIFIVVGVVIASLAVLIILTLIATSVNNSQKYDDYDISSLISSNVSVEGAVGDTHLVVNDTVIDQNNAYLLLDEEKIENIDSELAENIKDYFTVSFVNDVTKLSNGDSVEISVDYDNDKMKKEFGVKFSGGKELKIIEGIANLKTKDEMLDIFNYVDVTFEGYEGVAKVNVKAKNDLKLSDKFSEYKLEQSPADDDCLCAFTIYKGDTLVNTYYIGVNKDKLENLTIQGYDNAEWYKLKNGDNIDLNVSESHDDSSITLLNKIETVTVSGLGKKLSALSKINKNDLDEFIKNTDKKMNAEGNDISSKNYYHTYIFENDSSDDNEYKSALVSVYVNDSHTAIELIIAYEPYICDEKLHYGSLETTYLCISSDNILEEIRSQVLPYSAEPKMVR